MVKKNTVARKHFVSFTEVDGDPVGIKFGSPYVEKKNINHLPNT